MLRLKELLLKVRVHLKNLLQKNLIVKIIHQEVLDHRVLKVAVKETQEIDADSASFFSFLLATFVNQISTL
jgi:hypothetical protein